MFLMVSRLHLSTCVLIPDIRYKSDSERRLVDHFISAYYVMNQRGLQVRLSVEVESDDTLQIRPQEGFLYFFPRNDFLGKREVIYQGRMATVRIEAPSFAKPHPSIDAVLRNGSAASTEYGVSMPETRFWNYHVFRGRSDIGTRLVTHVDRMDFRLCSQSL